MKMKLNQILSNKQKDFKEIFSVFSRGKLYKTCFLWKFHQHTHKRERKENL